MNLLTNAVQAMPSGGTLRVSLDRVYLQAPRVVTTGSIAAQEYLAMDVSDSGNGIPAEIFEKIFDPFFTTKEVGKGTGLGLSMVYGIVKQSGGYIYPESEVGRGTSFRMFLPRHIPEVLPVAVAPALDAPAGDGVARIEAAPVVVSAEPLDLTGKSAVVLLVEDEEAVRRGGKRMLETRGYTVHEAGSGTEALDIMDELEGKVDIVVSDVVMPEMDGPTLLTELRKTYPDLKFIFVSGYAEDAFARNLSADAKFGFLPKPFSLKQLAVAVREMLDSE
jgi:two-component system cell cycle sensor histidine kinase/response regulator CckA